MIRAIVFILPCLFWACAQTPTTTNRPYPQPGQGVYVYPENLRPAPLPRIPPVDACRSQLYQGLIGQHEGAIYIPGLPGRKRVLKPAFDEGFEYQAEDPLGTPDALVEVRDYLPDQTLYVPSIRTGGELLAGGDYATDRLTVELDQYGYVQEIRCG